MKQRIFSIALFLMFLVAAYVFLIKGVRPFLEDVVTSDLFLEISDDPAVKYHQLENEKTRLALLHCNRHLQENLSVETTSEPTEDDYKAWALGNYSYMVSATIPGVDSNGNPKDHKVVCKIQYVDGDEMLPENWEITQFNVK